MMTRDWLVVEGGRGVVKRCVQAKCVVGGSGGRARSWRKTSSWFLERQKNMAQKNFPRRESNPGLERPLCIFIRNSDIYLRVSYPNQLDYEGP